MELILRWDVCVVIMKDIIYKCYRAESDTLRFTAYVMIKWRHLGLGDQAGPDASKHGLYTFAWNQKGANNVFTVGWYSVVEPK